MKFHYLAWGIGLLSIFVQAVFGDEVRTWTSQGGERSYVGTVLDYRGDGLKIRSSAGRETEIPGDRVIAIEAEWLADHREADKKFAEYDFAAASKLYGNAFRQESRRWVQRQLLAQVVRCQRNLGDYGGACKNFARLVDDDESTPYFDAIPLAWTAQQPERELEQLSGDWINDAPHTAQRLMAASWLLTSPARAAAVRALRDLVRDADPRISSLAIGQSWRIQVATASRDELEEWDRRIRTMPWRLRGGPYYVLGMAYARLGMPDEALLALMRSPTTYASAHDLAQLALFESGKILQEQGHVSDALRLYKKTLAMGQHRFAAEQARQRITELLP